jgi:tetratricopeptide (TPR) repeat protein
MRRISLATPFRLTAALVLALGLSAAARGDDAALRQRIVALGQTSGNDTIKAEVKALVAQPEAAKKLIAEAVDMAKAKNQPLAYNAAFILGEAAAELKDLKSAEALLRVCTASAARLKSTRKLLQSYGALIDMLYDSKKYAASAKVCQELLELKTGDGKARIYYLAVQTPRGDLDFFEDEDFDPAKPLRPGVHRLMIQAVAKLGKFDKALKLADNLIKAQDTWEERQLRAWVLREAGRYEDAAKAYQDVLERVAKDKRLDQEDKDSYVDRYRYLLSNVYVELKRIDKAEELLRKLIEKRPDEAAYYNDLGYILADHDMKIPEAEQLIRKALELDRAKRQKLKLPPGAPSANGAYLDSLGWVLYKQKKYKEAKEALQEAVKDKDSQHIEIYDHLGDVLMALGERTAAIAAWRRGLELAGESPRERERRAEVERKLQKYASR